MLTERPVHADLRTMLMANQPFVYAHLIKFERPYRMAANGVASTSKEKYAYLTDASRDVNFDDGSTNLNGVANGSQVYVANKVLEVSGVAEQTEAKASNFSITLDGNAIGAYAKGSVAIATVNSTTYDLTWPADVDLTLAGFREGDKVTITALNYSGDFNIQGFRAGNVLRITKIEDTMDPAGTVDLEMSLASEEIKSILLDKNIPEYASFVNREVFIYRGYFRDGTVVGSPVLIFKGIISNVSFEDGDSAINVTWGLTSHWGDFSQVKGRITSDDFHRALDQNGNPQPQSTLKLEYAYDKGFAHSETSINMLSTYTVQVEKQTVKAKNGFMGIGSKVKVKKTMVDEARTTDLDFQLQAKSIPVIYGVRNTTGIPFFADTLKNDSSTVYVAYALSEGEIGGVYDVYIDGNSLICNDKADFDARSQQTADNTVELICRGRADRGDVLGGATSVSTAATIDFYSGQDYLLTNLPYNLIRNTGYKNYVAPVTTVAETTGKGVIDGESIKLTSPQEITLDVFSGKTGQKASSQLVSIAKANNFKVQNDYWTGTDTAEYWGPNHRVLDTAYILGKFKIAEGETSIPSLEFIIKGKSINCYNYDYSYSHYNKATGENANNFLLGDMVTLYNMSGVAITASPVQIVDKWTFINPDGTSNTRFIFDIPPPLGLVNGVPSVTQFYMQSSGGAKWTMITHNFVEFNGGIQQAMSAAVTGQATAGGYSVVNFASTTGMNSGGDSTESTAVFSLVKPNGTRYSNNRYFNSDMLIQGSSATTTSVTTKLLASAVSSSLAQAITDGASIVSRNTIRLNAAASSVAGYYNGHIVKVTRYNSTLDRQIVQEYEIVGYTGGTDKIATIDGLWDPEYIPTTTDSVQIFPKYRDSRVSINPAIQTLDYITSTTYGRGLDVYKDLDLPSWLESGRACDVRSNVTVQSVTTGSYPVSGHVYRYPASGTMLWQGTYVGRDGQFLEFTNILGKLTNAWNNWKSYKLQELVYYGTNLYEVTAAGVKTTAPTHTSGTVNGLLYKSSLSLTSTNGGPGISLAIDGNPIRAMKNGSKISGYSLYDSDEVDYWRLLGWDENNQRYVTRHQTNLSIDTSLALFDNMNSLLEHFGGILRYSGNKYYLEVEEAEGVIASDDNEVRNITADQIIGKIRLSDEGIKSAFNSLTAAYADPANKFEARNISFFNSDYLKADRNVPKKGSVTVPGITNYYNTRILADKYLNKTRFGLTVSFNMAPRGLLLLAGKVIQIQYPRYGWVDKKFRISTLTHQQDATVDIVAEEYDDSFYVLSKISKQAASGLGGLAGQTTIASPTGLRATSLDNGDEAYSSVNVTWVNNPLANTKNVYTELYSSSSSNLYLTVNTISDNVLTSTVAHELQLGDQVTSQVTLNGLEVGKTYFVKSIPSSTQFTLSDTKEGAITGLTNGTSLGAIIQTASLLQTLPIPTSSFIDPVGSVQGRIVRYYWVRHKIIQG